MSTSKRCFVVSPIGEPDSDTRDRADKLFEYVITPAVEAYGFNPIRADRIAEPGIITSQIIEHVVESPLVIADLTGSNANVFYELAVRHAIQKPLIQLIQEGDSIPFDVAGTRTIQIELSDIESVESAKEEIGVQINHIQENEQDIDTPISVALDLKRLRESGDPEERSLADIMESLSEIRTGLISVQKMLNSPQEILPPGYVRELTSGANFRYTDDVMRSVNVLEREVDRAFSYLRKDEPIDDETLTDIEKELQSRVEDIRYAVTNPSTFPTQRTLAELNE